MTRLLIVDALAREHGRRLVTVDVIGAGPRAVAGLLEKLGYQPDIHPLENILENPKMLSDYDLMFVSAMTCDYPAVRNLVNIWRKYSNGLVVVGGPIAVEPLKLVKDVGVDVVFVGEAEVTLPQAVNALVKNDLEELYTIKGVCFKFGKRVVFTGRPDYAPKEALAYKHSTRVQNYPLFWASRVYVEIVRGCSNWRRPKIRLPDGRQCIGCDLCFKGPLEARLRCPAHIPAGCGYCSVPHLYGPARSRPADVIVREVRELVKLGVTRIVLSAPDVLDYGRDELVHPKPLTDPCNPAPNIEALKNLLDKLLSEVGEFQTRDAYLMIENVKACLVTEEVAKLLGSRLRGTPVHIGVETGDDMLASKLGRPCGVNDVKKAVSLLKRHGLEPYVYFIYGLPGETRDSISKTLKLMDELWSLGAHKVTVYKFRPLPGTAFQDFSPPEPGSESYMVLRKARELNYREKLEWVGRRVRALIVGVHPPSKKLVAYPLPHGPVVLVQGSNGLIGWKVLIEIVGVISDRMLSGRVVRKLKRVSKRYLETSF